MDHLFSITNGNKGGVEVWKWMSAELREILEKDYEITKKYGDEIKWEAGHSTRDCKDLHDTLPFPHFPQILLEFFVARKIKWDNNIKIPLEICIETRSNWCCGPQTHAGAQIGRKGVRVVDWTVWSKFVCWLFLW